MRIVPAAGWQRVRLDRARRTVRIPAGVEIDLGATAKALAADRSARRVYAETGAGALVNLGGDIALAGPRPQGGWPILVTDDHRSDVGAEGQTSRWPAAASPRRARPCAAGAPARRTCTTSSTPAAVPPPTRSGGP